MTAPTTRRRRAPVVDRCAPIPADLPYAADLAGRHHRQVRIYHPDEWRPERGRWSFIDAGMAALILACWRLGITTMHSCQQLGDWWGDPAAVGFAYVGLPLSHADRLLGLAGSSDWPVRILAPEVYPDLTPDRYAYVYLPPAEVPEVTARLQALAVLGGAFDLWPNAAAVPPSTNGDQR